MNHSTPHEKAEWQVAVFCHNEASRIADCLASIAQAAQGRNVLITVIVNGSTDGSEAAAKAASANLDVPVWIFRIPHADKSNAINAFLHDRTLRAEASLYFCVDAYVTICPDGLRAMAACLSACPDAVAASGMLGSAMGGNRAGAAPGGVMQGQFYALTPGFVRRMAETGARLPIGLYRGDGLLGSMAAHDLDAIGKPWVNERLPSVPDATFTFKRLSPFRPQDVRRHLARKVRQMRGKLENASIKQVIYARGYAGLPSFADDMIRDFLAEHPVPDVPLLDRPFMAAALRHHRAATQPALADLQPRLVADIQFAP